METKVSQSSLLGAAGEHYVMSELLRRGYIAALAPQGVPNVDIVVTDQTGKKLCSIQVKARRDIGSDGGWHMKAKHELMDSKHLFYCFVDFGKSQSAAPKVYILPSMKVAEVLKVSHEKWRTTPGKNGQPHKDGPMRRLLPDYSRIFGSTTNPYPKDWLKTYHNRWELLGLEPATTDDVENAD